MICAKHVSFQFMHHSAPFLQDIQATVNPGEVVVICGKSGSGKTTFSRLINGVAPHFVTGELTGELLVDHLRAGIDPIEAYVPVVGSVFQNPKTQHFAIKTTDELAFPCENIGMDPEAIRQRIQDRAEWLGITHLLDRSLFELSGGEKQLIAIATATMLDPKILVLDEVTSNLDQPTIQRIGQLIQVLKEKGMTIILCEHRLAWTRDWADRYLLFESGRLTHAWSQQDMVTHSDETLHHYGLRTMDLSTYRDRIAQLEHRSIVHPLIEINQLAIGYDQPIKKNIDLTLGAGEIVGLLGANGAGKSTLAQTLVGLKTPLAGSIHWQGDKLTEKQRLARSFLVMQDTNYQLFSESVCEEVQLGAQSLTDYDKVMEQMNLVNLAQRHPRSLSGGEKQRVMIAAALLSGKPLLIFDEPTSGLDYDHMTRFGSMMHQLRELDRCIVIITHDEELAASWCDRIVYLS